MEGQYLMIINDNDYGGDNDYDDDEAHMKNKGSRRSENGGSNFQRFAIAATIVVCDLGRINMMMVIVLMVMMVMVLMAMMVMVLMAMMMVMMKAIKTKMVEGAE